jgi:tellurite resistance protein TerC
VNKTIKKMLVLVMGGTVILVGLIMIVTPGPAIIVIPAGLAILATEFVWARKLLNKMKEKAARVSSAISGKKREPEPNEKE